MLQLSQRQLEQLHRQALDCYPEECCGLLLGYCADDFLQVTQLWQTVNSWTEDFLAPASGEVLPVAATQTKASRLNRFAIAPLDILRAQKYARTQNQAIIGIYHSHPNYPAVPSEYDRHIAWEQYSYVIMSVTEQQVTKTRSWRLTGDRQFTEEPVAIAP